VQSQAREFKPNSCAVADSLLGRPVSKPRNPILGLYDRQSSESMVFSAEPWASNATRPLKAVWVTTHFAGDGPVKEPVLGFQVRLEDTLLRVGLDARLSFQFDSSSAQTIGQMQSQQFGSSGRKIDQVMTIGLTAVESRQLAAAGRVRGMIGNLTFEIPSRVQEGITAVYVASACGVKLR
jgi:hypothetical protein